VNLTLEPADQPGREQRRLVSSMADRSPGPGREAIMMANVSAMLDARYVRPLEQAGGDQHAWQRGW